MHVFVRELLEGVLSADVSDDFAEFGGVVVADGGVEGGGAEGGGFELGELGSVDADFFGEFVVGGLTAELFAHAHGDAAHLGDFVHHVDGEADGLGLVGEGAFDGLLDPPGGVGGELAAFVGVEALDGFHEADVAFRDEVEQGEAVVGVVLGDFDDEPEVGSDHVGAGSGVAYLDAVGELNFLIGGEEGGFSDFSEVDFDAAV